MHCVCLHAILSKTKVQVVLKLSSLTIFAKLAVSCALGVNLHHPLGALLAMANILLQFLPGTFVEASFVSVELRTVGGDR